MKDVWGIIIWVVLCFLCTAIGWGSNRGMTEYEKLELVNAMLVDASEHFGELEGTQAGEAVAVCIHSVLTYGGEGE